MEGYKRIRDEEEVNKLKLIEQEIRRTAKENDAKTMWRLINKYSRVGKGSKGKGKGEAGEDYMKNKEGVVAKNEKEEMDIWTQHLKDSFQKSRRKRK